MKKKIKDNRRLITKSNPNSPISEQFKIVRAGIEFAGIDHAYQTILITSPEATSGKSTVAANLSIVYAQKGKKTLLIDADMRKPTIHNTFMKSNTKGLSITLTEELEITKSYQKTDIQNLYVLTSGIIPPNPNELLSSNRMSILLNQLKKIFDIIIIDTPPITFVSDALVLMPQVDGVLLVVRNRVTSKDKFRETIKQIGITRIPIIGVVFNRDVEKLNSKYYYSEK
ncbi:CpsD/CapB family tyrosine-protein kinase [Carnobacterium divergens]|uniref:Tyrosine-protein kinase CpsD n=1 Tax=Carnobacterium divergens TaxID=2748 RepID=A0AAW8RFM7_CARDV|nr:CpsD/CapB family tyrosine-protein kinase [Carnobacterium divergens]MDT1959015.1 CpsD/CapB family tyrosine-protein kinase [Carnobacterium divergens]MDT1974983.1 CpsD/CapB family tyrosine-protein kinase [Carnobacterium divergens]MDT2012947.1 CpsD/CapB family tyrosine-protein kinase [Carnobacterium divergens]